MHNLEGRHGCYRRCFPLVIQQAKHGVASRREDAHRPADTKGVGYTKWVTGGGIQAVVARIGVQVFSFSRDSGTVDMIFGPPLRVFPAAQPLSETRM